MLNLSNANGYLLAVSLFLLCCWVNPNNAIPYRTRLRGKEQTNQRLGIKTKTSATNIAHRVIEQPDLGADKKPALSGGGKKWRKLRHPRSPDSSNENVNVNVNRFDLGSIIPRPHRTSSRTTNEPNIMFATIGPKAVKSPIDSLKTHEINCTETHNANDRYSSSFIINSTLGNVNISGNNPQVEVESGTKKTTSLHVGEDVTLCWIETTTIKEDRSCDPVKRLVMREYTISFENSASIPAKYLECVKYEDEVDGSVPKSALFEVIDQDTHHSRVVNFTTVSHVGNLTVWRYSRIRCGMGPVVTKNIIEWTNETSDNPKTRVEIKVSPKTHNLTANVVLPDPCATEISSVDSVTLTPEPGTDSIETGNHETDSTTEKTTQTTVEIRELPETTTQLEFQITEATKSSDGRSESTQTSANKEVASTFETTGSTTESATTIQCDPSYDGCTESDVISTTTEIPELAVTTEGLTDTTPKLSEETTTEEVITEITTLSSKIGSGHNTGEVTPQVMTYVTMLGDEPAVEESTTEGMTSSSTLNSESTTEVITIGITETTTLSTGLSSESIENQTSLVFSDEITEATALLTTLGAAEQTTKELATEITTFLTTLSSELTTQETTTETTILPIASEPTESTTQGTAKELTTLPMTAETTTEISDAGTNVTTLPTKLTTEEVATEMSDVTTQGIESPITESEVTVSATELVEKTTNLIVGTTPIGYTEYIPESTTSGADETVSTTTNTVGINEESATATSTQPTTDTEAPDSVSSNCDSSIGECDTDEQDSESHDSKSSCNEEAGDCASDSKTSCDKESGDCSDVSSSLSETTCDEESGDCSIDATSSSSPTCDEESEDCTSDSTSCDEASGSSCSDAIDNEWLTSPILTTLNELPTTIESSETTATETTTESPKPKHKLALKIKLLLEHIDMDNVTQKLVEVEKHLLFDEKPNEHGDPSLINQVKTLNNSITLDTVQALFNCSSIEKITGDIGSFAARYSNKNNATMNSSGTEKTHVRQTRDLNSPTKQELDSSLRIFLPGIHADIHSGLSNVMTRMHDSENRVSRRSVDRIPRSRILKILTNPQVADRLHDRTKRQTIEDLVIDEKDMPKDVEEVGHWSNERVKRALNGGRIRSLTEFTIYKDP